MADFQLIAPHRMVDHVLLLDCIQEGGLICARFACVVVYCISIICVEMVDEWLHAGDMWSLICRLRGCAPIFYPGVSVNTD